MAAEAMRKVDYANADFYGSAAPVLEPYTEPAQNPQGAPLPQERPLPRARPREKAEQRAPAVSLFAVFGTVFAGILMVFVMLAQINYNEVAGDIIRLNRQMNELKEQERRLEIEFESVIDMKEIERYARDSLGMSKPDMDQVAIIRSMPVDRAEIIPVSRDSDTFGGFTSFISSLLDYFR